MKFLKKIQRELIRTMKIKYLKVGLSVSRTRVVRFMVIALTAIPRFSLTNFSIRYMVLFKDSDTRRILNLKKFFLKK